MKPCGLKSKGLKILATSKREREKQGLPITVTDIAKHLGVKRGTVTKWLKELPEYIDAQIKEEEELGRCDLITKAQKAIYIEAQPKTEEEEAAKLVNQIKAMDEAVFEAATIKHISKMAELWYKRQGLLIEKTEQKIEVKVDATELARQHAENQRWLRDNGYLGDAGVGQVFTEPALLPETIRED